MTDKPLTPREDLAHRRALALAPYVLEAVHRAVKGQVKYNVDRVREGFEVIGALAPIIDGADIEEVDKLALNAAFGLIMKIPTSGQLTDRKARIAFAMLDSFQVLSSVAMDFFEIEGVEDPPEVERVNPALPPPEA